MACDIDRTANFFYSNVVMKASQQLNKRKIFSPASSSRRIIAGAILLAAVILFGLLYQAAKGIIDIGVLLGPCGFKQKYALPCPACGMTTSAVAFAQGRIFKSFYIQPAGAFLCCLLVISAGLAFVTVVFGVYFEFIKRFFAEIRVRYIILALVIVIVAGWAVTLSRAMAETIVNN